MPTDTPPILNAAATRFDPGAFHLDVGPCDAGSIHVRSFRGQERLSRPYHFDVKVLVLPGIAHKHVDRGLIGARALFRIDGAHGPVRRIKGIVSRVRSFGVDPRGRGAFELRISPSLARLSRRSSRRIFQDKTVVEIVGEVLRGAPIEWQSRLERRYPKRTYCVQYDETDLAFVERLLSEEGIYYYFLHPDGDDQYETVVLGDSVGGYAEVEGESIAFVEDRGLVAVGDHIDTMTSDRTLRPGRATVREYDFIRPSLHQAAEAEVPRPEPGVVDFAEEADISDLEVYQHYDEFEGGDVTADAARAHLDALRRDALVFRGRGSTRRALPGVRFKMDWPLASELGEGFCFVRVDHVGHAPSLSDEPATSDAEPYVVSFVAVPSTVCRRPRRKKRRAQQVLETARVSGPKDSQIHVDDLGRVKVRFHWDRDGADDGTRSCWIRVAQTWSGTGWGFQFIPRVGMEVLSAATRRSSGTPRACRGAAARSSSTAGSPRQADPFRCAPAPAPAGARRARARARSPCTRSSTWV